MAGRGIAPLTQILARHRDLAAALLDALLSQFDLGDQLTGPGHAGARRGGILEDRVQALARLLELVLL